MLNFAAQAARDCRAIAADLRRGHVRHLPDGRRIWIQPALVGDPANGRIRKFYQVRTAA